MSQVEQTWLSSICGLVGKPSASFLVAFHLKYPACGHLKISAVGTVFLSPIREELRALGCGAVVQWHLLNYWCNQWTTRNQHPSKQVGSTRILNKYAEQDIWKTCHVVLKCSLISPKIVACSLPKYEAHYAYMRLKWKKGVWACPLWCFLSRHNFDGKELQQASGQLDDPGLLHRSAFCPKSHHWDHEEKREENPASEIMPKMRGKYNP